MFLGHRNHDEFWVSELLKSSYDHLCKWAACGNPEQWFLGVKLWYLQQAPLPTPAVGHKHSDKTVHGFCLLFQPMWLQSPYLCLPWFWTTEFHGCLEEGLASPSQKITIWSSNAVLGVAMGSGMSAFWTEAEVQEWGCPYMWAREKVKVQESHYELTPGVSKQFFPIRL